MCVVSKYCVNAHRQHTEHTRTIFYHTWSETMTCRFVTCLFLLSAIIRRVFTAISSRCFVLGGMRACLHKNPLPIIHTLHSIFIMSTERLRYASPFFSMEGVLNFPTTSPLIVVWPGVSWCACPALLCASTRCRISSNNNRLFSYSFYYLLIKIYMKCVLAS